HGGLVSIRNLFRAGIGLIAAVSLLGQATDGNVVGTVSDPSGRAVPGATLRMTNVQTDIAYSAKTGVDGLYRFQNLPGGNYQLSATAQGFTAASIREIVVHLNQTSTANVTLQLGALSTRVDVTDAPA